MRLLFISFFFLFSCCKKVVNNTNENEEGTKIKIETLTPKININFCIVSEINNSQWLPESFIKAVYNSKNEIKRNNKDYPYELIHIKNWKNKEVFSESAGLDYRKVKVHRVSNNKYLIKNLIDSHYKNKQDSLILFVNSKGILNLINSKKDTIRYASCVSGFNFKQKTLTQIKLNLELLNKKIELLDEHDNMLDNNIYFVPSEGKIIGSVTFQSYSFTNYFLNDKYQVVLNGEKYFFTKNDHNTIILERVNGNKVFKLIEK